MPPIMTAQAKTVEQIFTPANQEQFGGRRCLHQIEGGYPNLPNDVKDPPEIRPTKPNSSPVEFTKDMQLLTKAVMRHFNPSITDRQMTGVFLTNKAFCNNQGFPEDAGDPPKANWFEMETLTADNPKLMKALICGGTYLPHATTAGGSLVCIPGRDGINANGAMPSLEVVLANHWYFHAVYVRTTDLLPAHFPNGPIVIPYFLRETVTYPLAWFAEWSGTTPPDPLKVGG